MYLTFLVGIAAGKAALRYSLRRLDPRRQVETDTLTSSGSSLVAALNQGGGSLGT